MTIFTMESLSNFCTIVLPNREAKKLKIFIIKQMMFNGSEVGME